MNTLIIGQGLAGSVLAWNLLESGFHVTMIDEDADSTCTKVAGGLVNPITGKRLVKSWRFDEFWPAAQSFYRAVEEYADEKLLHIVGLVRILHTPNDINDWISKSYQEEYQHLMRFDPPGEWTPLIRQAGDGAGEGRTLGAWVDFPKLIRIVRQRIIREGEFRVLKHEPMLENLQNEFDFTIWCAGWKSKSDSKIFPGIQWQLAKGERLIIHIPAAERLNHLPILKQEIQIIPQGNGLFWAGANYDWDFENENPSADGLAFVKTHLDRMLDTPYRIVDHASAVRPTIKDRRPVIGRSPIDDKNIIFNGLGTKGALLAPFWARHLIDHITTNSPIDNAVNVQRFATSV